MSVHNSQEEKQQSIEGDILPIEYQYLKEDSLCLRNIRQQNISSRYAAPPQTPNSEYEFENSISSLPIPFPDLTDLEIPCVREKGVKFCIQFLGNYFKCADYKYNLLQFWFLDIITDCLWTAQDDYNLSTELQKLVLKWVLYFIDLLRDPEQNLSRRKFFAIFKEAIGVAAKIIDEGCVIVPTPIEVFALMAEEEETKSWKSSDLPSESSIHISESELENVSYVEINTRDMPKRYELPKEICTCNAYDLSSVDSATNTTTIVSEQTEIEESIIEEAQLIGEEEEEWEDISFYQPDLSTPSSFLSLTEKVEDESESDKHKCIIEKNITENMGYSNCEFENLLNMEDELDIYEIKDDLQLSLGSSITSDKGITDNSINNIPLDLNQVRNSIKPTKESVLSEIKLSKTAILESLAVQKLWKQRHKDMNNPRQGWIPTNEELRDEHEPLVLDESEISDNVQKYNKTWLDDTVKRKQSLINKEEDFQMLNFGVLWAIIDFIFKYFYETFQYTLVKLAFQATPGIICQKINTEWRIPKRIKTELQKPKVEKTKTEKAKKEKPTKEKPKKKKPEKEKKEKPDKKESKEASKPAKPVPLTKKEKEELERLRKEQLRIEEELLKIEENKRFMYPLIEAATDELFQDIFENWVKVDLSKGKGKEKKK